jgi:signal transduction histidine kinase
MPIRRQSLRWQIASLFAVTVALALTTFGVLTYRAVRVSAMESAKARLRSVVVQIETIANLGIVNQREALAKLSTDPAVLAALRDRAPDALDAAANVLAGLQGTAGNSVRVELRDATGASVLRVPSEAPSAVPDRTLLHDSDIVIGPMRHDSDGTFFSSAAPVRIGPAIAGHLIVTRRLGVGTANRRIILNQLGDQAQLQLGNVGEGLWSGGQLLPYPGSPDEPVIYERDGQRWVSVSQDVSGTPWLYAMEMPERVALAEAQALVIPLVLIGGLIAVVAAVIGLQLTRRVTTPLETLTAAAEAVARGDYDVEVAGLDRADEVGRLARAFETMHTSVRAMRRRLEADVDARTGELTNAVQRLRDLDEQLRRNQKLATLGQLSGSVSHELRNPLGVMNTVAFLLDALPDASPKLKEYAALLREQVRLSERIISDMLDRARSGVPQPTTVNVTQLLDDVLAHANIPAGITVQRHYGPSVPTVVVDRDHIRQITWNLVTNAVQAMHGGPGTLTVALTHTNDQLRLEVSDSGPGISADNVERIFEPMFTTKPDGVGLGLAISRALARSNGGDLTVKGAGRPGAAFVLDMPASTCQTSSV